jgi:hypothetical protein
VGPGRRRVSPGGPKDRSRTTDRWPIQAGFWLEWGTLAMNRVFLPLFRDFVPSIPTRFHRRSQPVAQWMSLQHLHSKFRKEPRMGRPPADQSSAARNHHRKKAGCPTPFVLERWDSTVASLSRFFALCTDDACHPHEGTRLSVQRFIEADEDYDLRPQSNLIRFETSLRFLWCCSRAAFSRACRSSCSRRRSRYCLLVSATAS